MHFANPTLLIFASLDLILSHKTIINCFVRQSRKISSYSLAFNESAPFSADSTSLYEGFRPQLASNWIIAPHYANIHFVLLLQNCHSFALCYFGLGSLTLTRRPTQNPKKKPDISIRCFLKLIGNKE